jgi:iron complex transport system permease protein
MKGFLSNQLLLFLPILLLIFLSYLSLVVGDFPMNQSEVFYYLWQGPWGYDFKELEHIEGLLTVQPDEYLQKHAIIWQLRLTELCVAILVGAILGFTGACLQTLFHNPLADPYMLGISTGGAVGAALVLTCWPLTFSMMALKLGSFMGSLIITLVIYHLSKRDNRFSIQMLLMSGVAINMVLSAVLNFLISQNPSRLGDLWRWMNGNLSGKSWDQVFYLFFVLMLGGWLILRKRKALAIMLSGDEMAYALGINHQSLKILIFFTVSAMLGTSIAVCGLIAFVGLIVPQLLRLVIDEDHSLFLISTMLWGSILLVSGQLLIKLLPFQLHIGTLTSALGGLLFVFLYLKALQKQEAGARG